MMKRVAVWSSLVIAGCAQADHKASTLKPLPPVSLSAPQIAAVETAVREGLKDPQSAQFRNVKGGQNGGSVTVCGEVNARNSYGGYPGFSPFIGLLAAQKDTGRPAFVVVSMESTGNGPIITRKMCADHGLT